VKNQKALLDRFSDIKVVNYQNLDKQHFEDKSKVILYSDNWPEGRILELAPQNEYSCFLNSGNNNFESELLCALKIQSAPERYLAHPLPFLFEGLPNTLLLPFSRKEDKEQLLHQVEPFLVSAESRLVLDHAKVIFEELFMNAVYDAPVEARKLGLPYKKKRCDFTFAFNKEKLIISCSDTYGSLDPTKLLARMRDIYIHGTKNIINLGQNKGGAGIGCSLLHHYSSSMIIGVQRGVRTRVTCTIPLKTSQKNFHYLGKNLQIINLTSSGGSNGE
jgi:hypothetical protein